MSTALTDRPVQAWNTMPGWGITANLLPTEIITARRVRVLRKMVLLAIAGVLALGVGGYVYGYFQNDQATSELNAALAQTAALHAQQEKYQDVVAISGQVDAAKAQMAGLLGTDVDMTALLQDLVARGPRGAIATVTVTLQAPGATSSSVATLPDPSGQLPVGMVTLSGDTSSMAEVAAGVKRLSAVPGIVEVYPSSQQDSGKSVTYSLQVTLGDKIYSHRYDVSPSTATTGGN